MERLRNGKEARLSDSTSQFDNTPPWHPLISNEQLIELLRTHLTISNLAPRLSTTTSIPIQVTQRNLDRELIDLLRMQLSSTRTTTTNLLSNCTVEVLSCVLTIILN